MAMRALCILTHWGMVTTADTRQRKPFSPDGAPVLRHIVNACLQGKCEDDTFAGHVQC